MNYQDAFAKQAKAKEKKAKRKAKRAFIAKAGNKPRLPTLKKLRRILWDKLTEYVKRRDGPICKICLTREGYALYHLIPQNEGNAVRYDPDNVTWGCETCNFRERNHRDRYVRIHEEIFGKDRMDRLWAKSRQTVQLRRPELERMIAEIEALTGAFNGNGSSK